MNRWKDATNSGTYKIITIESGTDEREPAFLQKVNPWHFDGINGFNNDCEYRYEKKRKHLNGRFCWRWVTTNSNVDFRMLTLE